MDKNLINIDDLFRQRLGDGEEEERAGAWVNMRNLLEEEMPTKRVAGIRWRRMLTYTAGLLLLASVAFGGYEVMTAHRTATGSGATVTAKAGQQTTGTYSHNAQTIAATGTITSAEKVAVNASDKEPGVQTVSAVAATRISSQLHNSTNKDGDRAIRGVRSTKNIAVSNTHLAIGGNINTHKPTQNTIAGVRNTTIKNAKNNNRGVAYKKIKNTGTVKASILSASTSIVNNNARKNKVMRASASSVASAVVAINNRKNTSQSRTRKTTSQPLATNTSATALHKNENNEATGTYPSAKNTASDTLGSSRQVIGSGVVMEKKDVNKIEVVQHYVSKPGGQGHMSNDTIDRTQISVDKVVATQDPSDNIVTHTASAVAPASNRSGAQTASAAQNSAGNGGKSPLLASAAKTNASSKGTDVVLDHTKRRSNTLSNFAEMVQDLKNNLGNARFAPGITGGINATFFSPNSITGFQLGVTGTFIFNDEWSFMAELKYFSRFSGNATINDNYVNYTKISGGYQRDSVQRYFQYNNLQSVELPLTLRYTRGKYTMFAGADLVYDFAINNDFANNVIPSVITSEQGKNIKSQFSEGDFSSRLGMGYLLGVGYHITPLLQADIRVSQTLWDNSGTSGAKILSNELYKYPSVQLSIGYTIKKKESRMP